MYSYVYIYFVFESHEHITFISDHDNVRSELTSITGELDNILSNLNLAKKATYSKK